MAKTKKRGITGDCTWTLDTDGLLTISGDGAMGNYTSSSSLSWGTNIKSVVIENGVTTIGSHAFDGCSGLTSVTIPNSVTTISGYAFYNCTGLTSVTIPESVTSIGYSAFAQCTSLTSVTIPNSVTTISYWAFAQCTSLMSVNIPNSVTTIGYWSFGYGENCYTQIDGFTIYCDKDSVAENYAKERGINYVTD